VSGRPGFFGGFRPGDAPERDVEFGRGSESQEGSPFIRLGDPRSGRNDGEFGTPAGFDPVWGTLGSPVAQANDPWKDQREDAEVGPIVDVEIFGDGFQISGQICTGQFPRLTDWMNMQQGFIRVQEASLAHLGHGNLPDPDHQRGTLWVRLNQIALVAERSVMATSRHGAPVVQKERRKARIVTPGYSLRGNLHVHAFGSMKQFLESPDPHFIPITELTIRWTSDPALVSRFPFGLINREQLISLLDEPATPAGEGSQSEGDNEAELPLQQRWGAA
jgi:hypothetical protein